MNYGRTGRELLMPSEVRRLDRKECILFLEGQLPVRDRKALPWEMPEKEVPYRKAAALNNNGGYVHPVRVIKNSYGESHTIREDAKSPMVLEWLDPSKTSGDVDINLSEEAFLRLNLHSEESDVQERSNPVPTVGTQREIDLSQPLEDCILAFADRAGTEEMDQILDVLEQGKNEVEIKKRMEEILLEKRR